MSSYSFSLSTLQNAFRRSVLGAVRLAGIRFLSKAQTTAFLVPYVRASQGAYSVKLPAVYDSLAPSQRIFESTEIAIQPSHAWRYERHGQPAGLLRNGCLKIGRNILNTDYGPSILTEYFSREKRTVLQTAVAVAPLSHFPKPVHLWGYYDYLFLVAAKICRMVQACPELSVAEAVITYPLFNTAYEQEFLVLMGFRADNIRDSRYYDVQFASCLISDNRDWFYPSPEDVNLLQKSLAHLYKKAPADPTRLYVSRAGRRRIRNEEELVVVLKKYDFIIVEDTPRSLAEQVALYQPASFIMGPHGAAFANSIWCQPGTQLFEIFSADYAPDYFLYLAQLLGLNYTACQQATVADEALTSLEKDIWVSVAAIEQHLAALFGTA